MINIRATLFMLAALVFVQHAVAEEGDRGLHKQFVACPVYRDTDAGPKSGCWLADERQSGRRFDVSGGLSKPMIGRAMLVEGVVSTQDSGQCGATVLAPVRVSVLEESCPEHIIPAEGYPGKRFDLPEEVMQPLTVPRQLPEGPYEDKTFTILFNFNASFLNYQYSEIILEKAALYIQASKPAAVDIVGFAATDNYVVSGRTLREPLALAEARARQVALALERLAPESTTPELDWRGSPDPISHYDGGLAEETRRRVEIRIDVK